MRRLLLATLLVAAGATVFAITKNGPAPAPAEPSLSNADQPIDLGLPQGPFDPVLAVRADEDPLRMPPPANVVVNNPAGESDGIVQSEVSIAVSGDRIIVGWNDGQGFVDGSTLSGYGYSTDRGATFTDGGSLPNGSGTAVFGDPTVVALPGNLFVYASLNRGSSSGITINRTTFSGSSPSWSNAVAYNDNGWSLDKEYLEYDDDLGRIYMSYVGFPGGTTRGRLTYSDDGGQTWSSPLTVNEGSSTNGYYPAVGVDGGIYVSWVQPLFSGNADLYARYSSDGGNTWAADRTLIHRNGPNAGQSPQCFNRGVNITWPSLAVDRSNGPHRGRVYAVYSDGGANNYDSYIRFSDDNGQTWTDQVKLNDNPNTSEQFWPQVTVGPDGRVSVGWYDRRNASGNNSLCDFYVTQSVDGGVTWGPNRRVSDTSVAWCNVPANIQPNFGDYIECVSDDRAVFGVWSDARNGDPDVVFGRIDDRQTLATNGSFGPLAPFSADAVAWLIPNEAEIQVSTTPVTNPADVAFISTVFGLLATPQETRGVFAYGGEALSGNLQLVSNEGTINGNFSLASTGANDIDFDFTATGDVDATGFLNNFSSELFLSDVTPGLVSIGGTVTFSRFGNPNLVFLVSGTIDLDGDPGGQLGSTHRLDQTATFTSGIGLRLHTRTLVEDGIVVEAPDVALGGNPPPLATIRQSPNPWAPGASIRFQLTHDAENVNVRIYTPDGRMVRHIADGAYQNGEYEIPFDGKDDQGRDLANGGYYLKLQASNVSAAAKLFVVR